MTTTEIVLTAAEFQTLIDTLQAGIKHVEDEENYPASSGVRLVRHSVEISPSVCYTVPPFGGMGTPACGVPGACLDWLVQPTRVVGHNLGEGGGHGRHDPRTEPARHDATDFPA